MDNTTHPTLDPAELDLLFTGAHTHIAWKPEPVADDLLRRLYDLVKMGPTSANMSPARFLFIRTPAGKARLLPTLMPGNVDKTKAAPVTVLIAYDLHFYEKFGKLAPWAQGMFEKSPPHMVEEAAFRNGSLQGAYLILAARALGLDCGPMSGFHADLVNKEFFPDGRYKANFLCNLGYGEAASIRPRAPRLDFDEACTLL